MLDRETALRMELVKYCHLMYERNLTFATGGNLSVRLDERSILITPSGLRKGEVREDDIIRVNLDTGECLGKGRPSMETPLHTAMYSRKVGAVVHGHPPYCTALSVSGVGLATGMVPEGVLILGEVPLVPYRTPGTEELAESLASHEAVAYLMENHGALTVGKDLEEAFNRLEEMEFLARVQVIAGSSGGVRELPEEELKRLRP
ncbi:MAG: class II aldolase/adducin family protein [Methanomassiliicoccales archaeon]